MRALPSAALRTCCAVAALLLLLLLAGAEGKKQVPEQVEKSLLSMFGLRSRPRPDRSKVVIPPAMLEMWRLQFEAQQQLTQARKTAPHDLRLPGRKTHGANTVRSFTHAESETDSKHSETHRFRLHFDVSSIPEGELLQAAELQLSHDSATAQRHSGSKVRVLVHDIVRRGGRGREPITRLVDSRLVNTAANGSVALDVLPAVRRWLQGHQHNHGLLVEVLAHDRYPEAGPVVRPASHHHVRLRRSAGESDDQWLPRQPVLLAFTDDRRRPQRRTKRGGPSSKSKSKAKQGRPMCQRHKLYVDFHDVGWNDWIVAPQGYEAYYCHGDCPFPLQAHLNATNHAIVQTLMNSMNPSRVPQACCVPTDLTSISMLYLDEESKVVLKNYMDMAVVGCGCR